MHVFHCHREMRAYLDSLNGGIAFVPTMGALHDGHVSLIDVARSKADHTVASVFVNPLQFAPTEDYDTYPSNNTRDIDILKDNGVTALYLPSAEAMYDKKAVVRLDAGRPGQELEGIYRPHFFGGVLTVVLKLFNRVRPDVAVFGEKDFQQLLMIRNMVRDLDLSIDIVGAPIIRDPVTGLALSSRNSYLSAEDMQKAEAFPRILHETAAAIRTMRTTGNTDREDIRRMTESAKEKLRAAGITSIDYAEARNAETLEKPQDNNDSPLRLLAVVRINGVRLLDNIAC